MDFVTIAKLSSDPSWRPEESGMEKMAWGWLGSLGTKAIGPLKNLWMGVRGQRAMNAATSLAGQAAHAANKTPWYKRLQFWNKPEIGKATRANKPYQAAEMARTNQLTKHKGMQLDSATYNAGSKLYQGGRNALQFGNAAAIPLSGAWMAGEPLRNQRQYAHGFTDASTQALEELSNTPWWKIMGLGLGKMMNPDILWDKVVDPVADRNFWSNVSDAFANGGFRDAGRAAMEVLGAREIRNKRDQMRNLRNNPEYLQKAVDDVSAYQKAMLQAQADQQTQS